MTEATAKRAIAAAVAVLAVASLAMYVPARAVVQSFVVDPSWPKPLPAEWGPLGEISGQAVDTDGHIWILHRALEPEGPLKPILEFDANGTLLQAWGGPGDGYTWPGTEHGLYVDDEGYVWTAGSAHQILKFTHDGRFVLAIGQANSSGGNADTTRLGSPADIVVDTVDDEVYVADGYGNHRVIVFDSNTGAYKRHWGSYGRPPNDADVTPLGWGIPAVGPVHCVELSRDGYLYVCDRDHYRIQVFRKDGTYVREHFVRDAGGDDPAALAGLCTPQCGPAFDVTFSPDPQQRYMYVPVSYNIAPANQWQTQVFGQKEHVFVIERATGALLGRFGGQGAAPGTFRGLHGAITDRDGNVYTAEITGKRAQKFVAQP